MKLPSLLPIAVAFILSGCTALPHSGPSYSSIKKLETQNAALNQIYSKITIVDLNQSLELMKEKNNSFKTDTKLLAAKNKHSTQVDLIGKGDSLKIAIMETPPAILFLGGSDSGAPKTGLTELPIVTVDSKGMISLPFVGQLKVLNQTPSQVQQEITDKLSGIANRPQIIVSVIEKRSSNITIIGDGFSGKMPITAKGERLLDAVTMLGSNMYSVKDTMVQIIRDDKIDEIPLSFILSNPQLNVLLQQDDVITLINKPSSFISMGATGASREVKFEAVGINLSQALARIGGVRDNQADARGVFIFRYQNQQTIDKLKNNVLLPVENSNSYIDENTGNKITVIKTTISSDELVPVVYQVDLSNPNSLFVMKNFEVQNNDIVYVASAPIIELQKFLYAIFSPGVGMINQVSQVGDL